jgi:hypothetical protein
MTPSWALTLAFWLHMLATNHVWFGGLAVIGLGLPWLGCHVEVKTQL